MGAQGSKNKAKTTTDITTTAYNSCPNVSANNSINLSGVQFRPDLNPACANVNSDFVINQSAGVESECVLTNLQNTTADTISKMDAQAQGGLGFQASSNSDNIKTQLITMTTNSCGDQTSSNEANISDTIITSCNWHFVQDASVTSSCLINNTQTIANQVSSQQSATSTGLTLASFLTGYGPSIIVIIIIIVVVGGIGYFGYKEYKKNKQSSTTSTSTSTSTEQVGGSWNIFRFDFALDGQVANLMDMKGGSTCPALIIAIIILVVIFLSWQSKKQKTITPEDMSHLNQTITEAHQIAGFGPGVIPGNEDLTKQVQTQIDLPSETITTTRDTYEDPFSDYTRYPNINRNPNAYQYNSLDDFFQPLI